MKNVKEIEIKIEGQEWETALDKSYKKKNKEIKIEGFRKGMAPKDLFIKKLGIEALYMDAVDFVTDDAYKKALAESESKPIVQPKLDIKTINEKEVVLVFTFIERPEVKLGEYKNLGLKKEKAKVTKEEIDDEIKALQEKLVEIVPKENGKVEEGNIAIIDFEGFVDGKSLEGGKGNNYSLEIGSNSFIPGFETGLIGMKTGETKELKLKFPEDYVADLKGKDVVFNVTVNEIKERIIPEVNEDFYQDLGYDNIKTESEFRSEVEKNIIERKNTEIEDEHLDKCLDKACELMSVEINPEIIDEEVHRMIHQFEQQLAMQGVKMADYMKITGWSHEDLHKNMEPEAIKRIKSRYLLEEIANVEKIDFTEEEVNKKAEEMAENYGISVDELIKAYGSIDVVKYDMKMHAALEIIKNNN